MKCSISNKVAKYVRSVLRNSLRTQSILSVVVVKCRMVVNSLTILLQQKKDLLKLLLILMIN
nr:MAG TPA: hypothetical protein [Bacteriophage sp.]